MSGTRPQACGESESWGAELALGLLSGPERAAGLSHLAGCPSCREQVDELARVADRLLLLAPEAEPGAGFESRVLGAVNAAAASSAALPAAPSGGGGERPRRPARLVGALVALVAAAAVGGGLVGRVLDGQPGSGPTPVRTGLAVSAGGRTSCRVVVSGTRPASVLVSLDGYPGADSEVTVELRTSTGAAVPLGPLPVTGGHGLLVTSVDADARSLTLMRMIDRDGRLIYEATLQEHRPSTSH